MSKGKKTFRFFKEVQQSVGSLCTKGKEKSQHLINGRRCIKEWKGKHKEDEEKVKLEYVVVDWKNRVNKQGFIGESAKLKTLTCPPFDH